jgi:MFS family permease
MYGQSLDIGSGILKPKIRKGVIYLLAFLAAFHITPATYVNSTFLGQFISDEKVGFIFTVSSILVLVFYSLIKNILKRFGNYRVFIATIWIDILSLAAMSSSLFINETKFAGLFIGAYVIGHVSRVIMLLCLDIFLENQSCDSDTGKTRGLYLTSLNFAFVVGPLLAGFLIIDSSELANKATGITPVYIFAILLLLPMLFIARKHLKFFVDSDYKKEKVVNILSRISHNFDLVKVCSTSFLLNFFYSWMIIYTPIFLISIGFEISDTVKIIGLALIAFVIFQLPVGKIADKFIGEKEIMTVGFLIAGIATISMSFISSSSFWVWTGIMFVTRIGASMIEIMNETYLFKKITDKDVDILSLYRSVSESAYVVAPIVASILLTFVIDIKYLFVVLGVIILYGIRFSITLKDTK